MHYYTGCQGPALDEEGNQQFKEVSSVLESDFKKLRRMGVLTGLAVALHNFPEGLATFIATLANPSLGEDYNYNITRMKSLIIVKPLCRSL